MDNPIGAHRGAQQTGATSRNTRVSNAAATDPNVAAVLAVAQRRLGLPVIPDTSAPQANPLPIPNINTDQQNMHHNPDGQPLPNQPIPNQPDPPHDQEAQSAALGDNVGENPHGENHDQPGNNNQAGHQASHLTPRQIEEAADLLVQQMLQKQAFNRPSVHSGGRAGDYRSAENLEKMMDDKIHMALNSKQEQLMIPDNSPFIPEILDALPPIGMKVPTPEKYTGKTDPLDYLQHFQSVMNLHCVPDAIQCKAFCAAFQEGARRWYNSLTPGSITCFADFKKMFLNQFATSKRPQKTALEVMQLVQGKNESLRDFMARFNNEAVEVPDLTCSSMLAALMNNSRDEEFRKSLALDQPTIIQEIRSRADKYIQLEEVLNVKKHESE